MSNTKSRSENQPSRFSELQAKSDCLFARNACVDEFPPWDEIVEFEAYLDVCKDVLQDYTETCSDTRSDGIVMQLPGSPFGSSIGNLARTVQTIVRRWQSSYQQQADLTADCENPGWQFTMNSFPLFIITFGPCYDIASSRFTFDIEGTFILFQPQTSFSDHHVPRGGLRRVRTEIRNAFENAGRPYDTSIAESALEAEKFVKPLALGAPPISWWKTDSS